jgi:hypothetical protein
MEGNAPMSSRPAPMRGMNPASRATFPTEAEAHQAGYHKAKNCP